MIRVALCLTLKNSKGENFDLFCERFTITPSGYLSIDYFEGGYNCCYKAEQLQRVSMVRKTSRFNSESEYLKWRSNFNIEEASKDVDFSHYYEEEEEIVEDSIDSNDFSVWDSLFECK